MPLLFRIYGLHLLCDSPIPGLSSSPSAGGQPASPWPVRVWLAETPPEWAPLWEQAGERWYTSAHSDSAEPTLCVTCFNAGAFFRFRYSDATEFLVAGDGGEIAGRWPRHLTLEDAATYLLGPILGFLLRRRGVTCLHASAVAVGEGCIVLAGPPGAGKSTAAAALAQGGLTVLSDDIVALDWRDGRVWAHSGYPRVNLWPDAVAALFGAADRQPLITRGWEKRYVDLAKSGFGFHGGAWPIAAIYLLCPQGERNALHIGPRAKPVAMVDLVANTYANYLLAPAQRAQEFAALGRLVQQVPVRRVLYSRASDTFSKLPQAVLADARSCGFIAGPGSG